MPESIHFPCPSCGVVLSLPLERAGWQGPCPRCGDELLAPDPARGLGAVLAPATEIPFQPFAEGRPAPSNTPRHAIVEPDPPPPPSVGEAAPARLEPVPQASAPAPPPAPDLRRSVLVLSVLLASVVSLVIGYLVGVRSDWLIARTPFPEFPAIPAADVAPLKPTPAPVLVKQPAEPDPEPAPAPPDPAPEPARASDAAEAALRAFLDAPDWSARAAYSLAAEKVRPIMEAYAREHPDGPTPTRGISVESSYTDPETGDTTFIFRVRTEEAPTGFPVAVAGTEQGWLVDWETFIEFRDDRFRQFAEGPADRSARFHLLVRKPTTEQAAGTENEHFTSLMVEPPMPDRQRLAYVRKGTETFDRLAAATSGGMIAAPVLELAKRTTPDGKSYLEITRILAADWLPESR